MVKFAIGKWSQIAACGCMVALLGLATGCPSSGSSSESNSATGDSHASSSSGGGSSAQKAWDDLRSESNAGTGLGLLGGLTPYGGSAQAVGQAMKDEERRANEEADRAMQTPLPIDAVNSMIDEMAQFLVQKLPNEPEVKNAPNQLVLAFGDIADPAGTKNPSLEMALDSVRSKLFESELMKANFVFVSTTEENAAKLNEKLAGKDTSMFRDPLQRTSDKTKPVVYDPASIFIVTGKLFSMSDHAKHTVQIDLSMQFQHVQSRRLVENKQFVRTYIWHPKKHEWQLLS